MPIDLVRLGGPHTHISRTAVRLDNRAPTQYDHLSSATLVFGENPFRKSLSAKEGKSVVFVREGVLRPRCCCVSG
jgi:hypothetical protein